MSSLKLQVITLSRDEWIKRCKIRLMQRSKLEDGTALGIAEECYYQAEIAGELRTVPPEQYADEELTTRTPEYLLNTEDSDTNE